MSSNWHYARNGQRVGPFSFEDLRRMASARLILPDDMVLEEAAMKWCSARDVKGLFNSPTPPAPTPPVPPVPPPPCAGGSTPPPDAKPPPPAPRKPETVGPLSMIASGAFLFLGYWLLHVMGCIPDDYNHLFNRDASARVAREVTQANPVVIPAETLAKEYQTNEIAADSKFKGKVLEITGTVTRVKGGGSGLLDQRPSLLVGGIRCEFRVEKDLEGLAVGHRVTVRGKCKGAGLLAYCQFR